jgi:REP element-mobilizing transposase RayT
MASTLTSLLVHIVFSTKHREPMIQVEYERGLFAYIGGICRGHGSALRSGGGADDHVHLYVSIAKTVELADLVMEIKRDSSLWMKQNGGPASFGWQDGYSAFSIGRSQSDDLIQYIENQRAHHQDVSFQDELRAFFRKYDIEFDERYVWG